MQFIRKSALVAAATLFTVSLFWFVTLVGFQRMLGSSGQLKQALKDSGIYNTIVVDALTQAQKDQQKKGEQGELDIPVNDPHVRSIINQAVSPSYLQQQTEGVLDNTFAWLKGDSPKLSFTIDLGDAKVRLADGVAAYAKEKATTLPPCPAAAPANGDLDIFKATCVPSGVTPDLAATQARNQIMQGEFLKNTKLTADDIKDSKGKPLGEQLKQAPVAYQRTHTGIVGLGIAAALLAAAVVALSAGWRSGVRKVAIIGIVDGALTVLLSIMAGLGLSAAQKQLDSKADQQVQHTLFRVMQGLVHNARDWWLWAGISLMVLGVVMLIVLRVTKSKHEGEGAKVKLPVGDDAIGAPATAEQAEPQKKESATAEKPDKKATKDKAQ